MSDNQQKNGNIVAIITMMFIYGMISFVTNAIMKNSMNMIAIANTLPLCSFSICFSFSI